MELEILKFSLQKERRKETKLIAFEWLIVWLIARSVLKWNWGARKKKKKKKGKKGKKERCSRQIFERSIFTRIPTADKIQEKFRESMLIGNLGLFGSSLSFLSTIYHISINCYFAQPCRKKTKKKNVERNLQTDLKINRFSRTKISQDKIKILPERTFLSILKRNAERWKKKENQKKIFCLREADVSRGT